VNEFILLVFLLTATGITTVWFSQGLLNQFLKNVLSIVACALDILFSFFFGYINKLSNVIDNRVTKPVRRVKSRIHIPRIVKALIYFLLGTGIFILDYFYGKALFNADETIPFYHVSALGRSYWISEYATILGGIFIFLGAINLLGVLLKALFTFLDYPVSISIAIFR
jgi:hypothetical protein